MHFETWEVAEPKGQSENYYMIRGVESAVVSKLISIVIEPSPKDLQSLIAL